MPELPDVETFRRTFARTALHQKIDRAEIDATRMLKGVSARSLKSRLEGRELASTARHGKYLFAELGSDQWLVLHFGMTGHLDYFKADDSQHHTSKHTRLLIRFSNGYRLAGIWQRLLGRISLAESPEAFVEQEALGPDALAIKLAWFKEMFRDRRGSVKGALMDQAFIAGIGNVYSDEMLFQAGIHPQTDAGTLGDDGSAALHRSMLHVLKLAIKKQADPDRMPDSWLLPRRKAGADCPRCGGRIKTMKASGRTAYLCPKCQRRTS